MQENSKKYAIVCKNFIKKYAFRQNSMKQYEFTKQERAFKTPQCLKMVGGEGGGGGSIMTSKPKVG